MTKVSISLFSRIEKELTLEETLMTSPKISKTGLVTPKSLPSSRKILISKGANLLII